MQLNTTCPVGRSVIFFFLFFFFFKIWDVSQSIISYVCCTLVAPEIQIEIGFTTVHCEITYVALTCAAVTCMRSICWVNLPCEYVQPLSLASLPLSEWVRTAVGCHIGLLLTYALGLLSVSHIWRSSTKTEAHCLSHHPSFVLLCLSWSLVDFWHGQLHCSP